MMMTWYHIINSYPVHFRCSQDTRCYDLNEHIFFFIYTTILQNYVTQLYTYPLVFTVATYHTRIQTHFHAMFENQNRCDVKHDLS